MICVLAAYAVDESRLIQGFKNRVGFRHKFTILLAFVAKYS